MNLPLELTLINPAFDILLITAAVYFAFYYFILKTNLSSGKVAIQDLKIFLAIFALFYLNYKGTSVELFGREFLWFTYFIAIDIIIEIIFMAVFWKKLNFTKDLKEK